MCPPFRSATSNYSIDNSIFRPPVVVCRFYDIIGNFQQKQNSCSLNVFKDKPPQKLVGAHIKMVVCVLRYEHYTGKKTNTTGQY